MNRDAQQHLFRAPWGNGALAGSSSKFLELCEIRAPAGALTTGQSQCRREGIQTIHGPPWGPSEKKVTSRKAEGPASAGEDRA